MQRPLFVLFALLTVLISTSSYAQEEANKRYFNVGPWFSFGASVMAGDVAEGYKIKARTSFTVGALGHIDISEAVGFNLGLSYESRGRFWYQENNEAAFNQELELNYLTISPLFNFRDFMLGFGIRLPMSGTLITKGTATLNSNQDLPLPGGGYEMETVVEGKIGANIGLLQTRGGQLNLSVLAGYDLTRPFKKQAVGVDPGQPDASLHLGLNYLFNAAELK